MKHKERWLFTLEQVLDLVLPTQEIRITALIRERDDCASVHTIIYFGPAQGFRRKRPYAKMIVAGIYPDTVGPTSIISIVTTTPITKK